MEKIDVKDLSYTIFPGTPNTTTPVEIYEAVFEFWKTEWQKVFEKIDPSFVLDPGEFKRQSLVTAIFYGKNVVAIQTLGHYHFDDIFSEPYFKPYTVEFVQELARSNIKKFQSLQFFLIGENYGVRQTRINLPAIMAGLSFTHQNHYGFDATISLGRKDVSAATIGIKFGMAQYGPDILMHNVPVAQLLAKQVVRYPKEDVALAIDDLWKRRMSYEPTKSPNPMRSPHEQSGITL